jgi:ribose 5-phosphate isomerase B
MIYIGSDHAGYKLKLAVISYFEGSGIRYTDLGPFSYNPEDDYPDYCIPVAKAVAKNKGSKGVVIGGSGEGEAIAANKVKGIRAVVVYDNFTARKTREHNDANVISLRGRGVPAAKSIALLKLWLKTHFSGSKKHSRRIRKIAAYER